MIDTTRTDAGGRYRFIVPAGEYKVRFHIPQSYLDRGYVFVPKKGSGDDENKVGSDGVTEVAAKVGPGIAPYNLTLDAAIHCGCADVSSDSVDTLNLLSLFLLYFGIIVLGSRYGEMRRGDESQ